MPNLELKSLSKCFTGSNRQPIHALRDVSLEIPDGELLAIVGPSASGKTTLLRLIAGLEVADKGQIHVSGKDITKEPARNRSVAMVFQSLALYPHLTVAENIGFGLRMRHRQKTEIQERTHEIATQLNISNCLDRKPFGLSGGQRQRVALARALVRRPQILLLDEPLSHLDGPLRRSLCRELRQLHEQFKLTTLLVTHETAEAKALGHRIVIMNQGKIEQVGTAETLQLHPAAPFVAEVLNPELI